MKIFGNAVMHPCKLPAVPPAGKPAGRSMANHLRQQIPNINSNESLLRKLNLSGNINYERPKNPPSESLERSEEREHRLGGL